MKNQTTKIDRGEAIRWEALQAFAKVLCPRLTEAYKRGGLDSYRLEGSLIAEVKRLQEKNKRLTKEINLLRAKIDALSQVSLFDLLETRRSSGGKT